jgi:endonuclease/exonuclease/phosphatase family metal-dependent hydrolase
VKFIDRAILIFNLFVITMTLLAYLAPNVNPNYTWVISFFGLFYPILILANILFIMFWMFRKWTRIWPSLVCLLLGWNQFFGFIAINSPKEESKGDQLNIVNYNISNGLNAYSKDKEEQSIKRHAMVDFLQSFDDVSIFCLQEVSDYGLEIVGKAFSEFNIYSKNKGAIIVSKYPIIKKGEIDFGTKTNSCLWADIKLPQDTVRVYSFHLQSNQISRAAENLANQTEIDQKKAWYDIKGILRKYKNRHIKRSKQVDLIAKHANDSPYKVFLGGDLNDPPQSYTYKIMAQLGKDAFRNSGSGIGTTYNGVIPLLRIDYMFVDPTLIVQNSVIVKENYSDHYPIKTNVVWPE